MASFYWPTRYQGAGSGVPPGPSSLLTDIVSYWNFNETSGTRADQLSVNDLSILVGSGIGSTPGIISNAMSSIALGCAETAGAFTPPPASFTFTFWVNYTSVSAAASNPVTFSTMTVDTFRFWMVQNSSSVVLKASDDNSTVTVVQYGGTLISGTTYFIICYYDDIGHEIGISVNNSTADTTSFTGPVYQGAATPFIVGSYDGHPTGGLNGWIDEMGYWSRLLTPTEKASLYNAGAGITYPFS